jgi:hypothetical protein
MPLLALPHYRPAMDRRTGSRAPAFLLAIWVALSPAALAVPATAMALESGACANMGAPACDCYDRNAKVNACAFVCISTAQFVAPDEALGLAAALGEAPTRTGDRSPSGRSFAPDPTPPRTPFSL